MPPGKGMGSASAPHDDSDLEDLIAKSPPGKPRSNVEIESSGTGGLLSVTPLGFITGSVRLCCYKFPCLCKCLFSLLFLGFISFLSYTVFSPTQEMGKMGADYSAINSAYDLSLSKVDHWCIQGDNDSCKCEDPLEPNSRSEFKSWNAAHKANVADVNMYRAVYGSDPTLVDLATGKPRPPIDVAFVGESVVEAMDGRWLGKRIVRAIATEDGKEGPEARKKPDIGKVFERMFRKEKGGPVEGVALGIAGDNTSNVLWRLQHDEMPYDFNPKVWWLVLGMNDLTRMQCSEEIVVLGILRVVEEIRLRKPDAHIVVNSLLPMINFDRMGAQTQMSDFADFKSEKDGVRESMEIDKAMRAFFGDKGPPPPPLKGRGPPPPPPKGRGPPPKGRGDARERKNFAEHGWHGTRNLRRKHKRRHRRHRNSEDDDATEGPELGEALERRKRIIEAKDKRFRDKVFRDNEKYRPKRPLSPLLPMIKKRVLPPVWPSVHIINDKLKEFCTKHESITFFDATPIFATDEGGGRHRLHNELISPRGHPSELGFAVWEGQIMGRLHQLLVEKAEKRASPERGSEPVSDDDEDDRVQNDEDDRVQDDEDKIVQDEKDSGIEEIEPVHKVDEEEDEEVSGNGSDHVSDGKFSEPPPPVDQPSRDEPEEGSEENGDGDGDGDKTASEEEDDEEDSEEQDNDDDKEERDEDDDEKRG